MDVKLLLNADRLGIIYHNDDDELARSAFERDYDRVVFSSAFRRMHGKTQVFPLPESDFTHTRLTHSLEVACVARSLGRIVGNRFKGAWGRPGKLASIAAAAALAHDMGNPPFGHSGEDSIAHYFKVGGKQHLAGLSLAEQADFEQFEGNALGFRLLARSKPRRSSHLGGLNLTYATLAAFAKYPRPAHPEPVIEGASTKKFGFFQSERPAFEEVAASVGLIPRPAQTGWCRHPLAFLVEAADDICYRICDLEDGYHTRLVPFDLITRQFAEIIDSGEEDISLPRLSGLISQDEQVGYLRAKAVNSLVNQAVDAVVANAESLLLGTYDEPLLEKTPAWQALSRIRSSTEELIYSHRPVIEVEAAGYEVLGGLLDDFVGSAMEHPRSDRADKILSLLSDDYREWDVPGASQYNTLMAIVEYVANMTDSYAIDTYRVLRGIELRNY